MNTGSLHIIKATSQQVFLKSGYFQNFMPSVRRCYDSKLIPFYFKYIPGGSNPESLTKSISLVAIQVKGDTIIDGDEISITASHLKEIDNTNNWTLYFALTTGLTGVDIRNGLHQYKITVEGVEYRSEPFMCCFNTLDISEGSFSSAFSSAFDVYETDLK